MFFHEIMLSLVIIIIASNILNLKQHTHTGRSDSFFDLFINIDSEYFCLRGSCSYPEISCTFLHKYLNYILITWPQFQIGWMSNNCIPDEDYSRNASCALHLISTRFVFNTESQCVLQRFDNYTLLLISAKCLFFQISDHFIVL